MYGIWAEWESAKEGRGGVAQIRDKDRPGDDDRSWRCIFCSFFSASGGCGMCHHVAWLHRMFSSVRLGTWNLELGLFSIFIVDCSAVIIIIPATFAVLPLITFLFWLCIIALLLPKSSLEF